MRFVLLLTVILITPGCMSGLDSNWTQINSRLPLETEGNDQPDFSTLHHRQESQAAFQIRDEASQLSREMMDSLEGGELAKQDANEIRPKSEIRTSTDAALKTTSLPPEEAGTSDSKDQLPVPPQEIGSFETVDANRTATELKQTDQQNFSGDIASEPGKSELEEQSDLDGPGKWKQELQSTIHSLEKSLFQEDLENDDQATMQIYLRLLHLISDNKSRAVREIPELSEKDQNYWSSQMKALTSLLNRGDDSVQPSETLENSSSTVADQALKHLRQAIRQLSLDADLKIRSMALCREVTGLGQIDEFESLEFSQNQQVLIYCELDNFVSVPVKLNDKTMYHSDLKGSLKILNEDSESVYQHQYSTVHDSARRQRQDFFMYFPLTIPVIPSGNYQLYLEIEDLKGEKVSLAERPIRFSVK